jgi:multiple sugar transport system ATP-binding protein
VTHDHDSAVSIVDRIGILHEGVLHQIDTPENLINNPLHINVASLINYPTINVLDCRLAGKKLNADSTLLYELTDAELNDIQKVTDKKDFQFGLKPRNIKMGKEKNQLSSSGKVLHTEYQGYNKVINIDLFGSNIRMITNETVHEEYGDEIDIYFAKKDVLLFGRDNVKRIK